MLVDALSEAFDLHRDPDNAFHMKAYMRNKFEFYGIKAPLRRTILKDVIAANKAEIIEDVRPIVKVLYRYPEREMHLCAMELFFKFTAKNFEKEDLQIIEHLICTNSWWDTVDYIAKNLLGSYLKQFPQLREKVIERFGTSENLWLERSTIIFQLGYKKDTDQKLLFKQCLKFSNSQEFFLQKAIGWALREYAKINPQAVLNFVNSHELKPLSKREAIRNII